MSAQIIEVLAVCGGLVLMCILWVFNAVVSATSTVASRVHTMVEGSDRMSNCVLAARDWQVKREGKALEKATKKAKPAN